MKTLKLLGIIALSALIVFWAVGCDDGLGLEPEEQYLEGTLTIKVSNLGPFVGNELEAQYSGYENISYEWFNGTVSMAIPAANKGISDKYTPEEPGSYTVKITCLDFEDDVMAAKNGPITVIAKPAYATNMFGTWLMKGSEHGNWESSKNGGTAVDETVVIDYVSFKLTNTLKLKSEAYKPGEDGKPGDYLSSADLGIENEFINYKITEWAIEDSKLITNISGNGTTGQTVSAIYKLTVTVDGYKGYKVAAYEPNGTIYLVLISDNRFLWCYKDEDGTAWKFFSAGGYLRSFTKQP